jgi:hypothetical protein
MHAHFGNKKTSQESRGALVPTQTATNYGLVRNVNAYALKIELIGV